MTQANRDHILEEYKPIVRYLQEQEFHQAEQAVIAKLKHDPLHAQWWVFLGEALLHQGYKEAAAQVFDRAWLLDPDAAWVKSVYTHLATMEDRLPRFDIEALLAWSPVPVTAIITVDQTAANLARTINSLSQAVDAMIVLIIDKKTVVSDQISQLPKVTIKVCDEQLGQLHHRKARSEVIRQAQYDALQDVGTPWVMFVHTGQALWPQDVRRVREAAAIYHRVVQPVVLHTRLLHIDAAGLQKRESGGILCPVSSAYKYLSDATTIERPIRIRLMSGVILNTRKHSHQSKDDALLPPAIRQPLRDMHHTLLDAIHYFEQSAQLQRKYRGHTITDYAISDWKAMASSARAHALLGRIEEANLLSQQAQKLKQGDLDLLAFDPDAEFATDLQADKHHLSLAAAYQPILQALQKGQYMEAEQLCVRMLEQSKLDASCWLLLALSLQMQGEDLAATRVFKRALLLNPYAVWDEPTWQRKLSHSDPEPSSRSDIDQLLQVEQVTVCAVLIVKDEARCIRRCIESIREAVDEIIMLDTGSTDGTLDIVAQFPEVKVYHYEWDHHFANARNAALQYVTSDWVFWLDADEYLHPDDIPLIREAAGLLHQVPEPTAYIIGQINSPLQTSRPIYVTPKMYARHHHLRYWGQIHEQIGRQEGRTAPLRTQALRIRLFHDGYEPSVMQSKQKLIRNITLLKSMLQEEPDDAKLWALLGREKLAAKQYEIALTCLLKAEELALSKKHLTLLAEIQLNLINLYFSQQKIEQAEEMCKRAIRINPQYPDVYYWLGHIHIYRAQQQLNEIYRSLQQVQLKHASGLNSQSPNDRQLALIRHTKHWLEELKKRANWLKENKAKK